MNKIENGIMQRVIKSHESQTTTSNKPWINIKMKGIFFGIYLIMVLMPAKVYSQVSASIDLICLDHKKLDLTFDDNIFLDLTYKGTRRHKDSCRKDTCRPFFEVVSSDSFRYSYKEKRNNFRNKYYTIYKIGVRLIKRNVLNIPLTVRSKMFEDTLYYVTLTTENEIYRLFGFYDTDISLFIAYLEAGELIALSRNLMDCKILVNKESKYFVKAMTKGFSMFMTEMNKPCNILKYYFQERDRYRSNTIILPAEPLKPFKVEG